MSKLLKNGLCILLCVLMISTVIPGEVFAAAAEAGATDENGKPTTLTNSQGDENVADEWEKAYPYGVFAFNTYGAATTEGGEALTVPVYRLGGTQGRATAYVIYNPAVKPIDEDRYGYANAISTDDIELEVEDPAAIAQYQPVGKDPDPEPGDLAINVSVKGDNYTLSLSEPADDCKWQSKSEYGWEDAFDASQDTVTFDRDTYEKFDFRCVYQIGDASYCTESVKGEAYVKPDPEILPEMPEDLDLGPADTFTKLEPDADDAFKAYVFPITFADGEWVKEIRVTPIDDELPECPEAAALIIQDCEGGCINKSYNTMTITVEDNDPAQPFELGITESKIDADKADGSVTVTVRRTGGFQEEVSIDYETVNGTALAGVDYIADADTMSFGGDVTEISLDIQLIDNGIKTDKPKTFTLRLKNLLGDGDDLCTLKTTEVTISLTNSGKATKENLASKLADADAIDLSSSDDLSAQGVVDTAPGTVTGTQVAAPEAIYAELKKGETVQGMLKSYHYPDLLDFSAYTGNGDYWNDTVNISDSGYEHIRAHDQEYMSFSRQHSNIYFDSRAIYSEINYVYMPIPHLPKLYSAFACSCYYTVARKYHMAWFGFGSSEIGTYLPTDYQEDRVWYNLEATENEENAAACEFDIEENLDEFITGECMSGNISLAVDYPVELYIFKPVLTRRAFADATFGLTIHTANDGENAGEGNVATAPEGAAAFTGSSVYEDIKPVVSIVPGEGGVNQDGKLYVGSKLKIAFESAGSFYALDSTDDRFTVYLARSDGKIVAKGSKSADREYMLELVWDDMTADDLNAGYTINIVLDREQNLNLDLSPSVPRGDDGQTPDLAQASVAYDAFWNGGKDYIEYGYSEVTFTAPFFDKNKVTVTRLNKADLSYDTGSGKAILSPQIGMKGNIQWLNFHRSHDDFIVVNGKTYAGDEQIWLELQDFNLRTFTFLYYSAEYASVPLKLSTSIDRVVLYRDGNGNNKVDGYVDEYGFFVLDATSGDKYITEMDEGDCFTEETFGWYMNDDGSYSQLFYKVYYTLTPRKLKATDEEKKKRAQVLPALITTVTDPENYFALTDEQKQCRYLISGQYSDANHQYDDGTYLYTSDEHLMYGGEATELQYVDTPLGGDKSPVRSNEDADGLVHYTWDPQFEGNLLFPYDDPSPIYIAHSLAGDDFPLASHYDEHNEYNEKDLANLNGYLGSYVSDTNIALCVAEQKNTVPSILAGRTSGSKKGMTKDNPDDEFGLDPEHIEPSPPDPPYDPGSGGDGDLDNTGDSEVASDITSGLTLNYKTSCPKMTIGLCKLQFATNSKDLIIAYQFPGGVSPASDAAAQSEDGASQSSSESSSGDAGESHPNHKWEYKNEYLNYGEVASTLFRNGLASAIMKSDKTVGKRIAQAPQFTFFSFTAFSTVSFAIQFKYDAVTNKLVFKKFTFAFVVGVQGSITWRPIPIFYVCVTAGLSVGVAIGFYQKVRYRYEAVFSSHNQTDGKVEKKKYLVNPETEKDYFPITYKSLNIQFTGKVGFELYEDEACTTEVKGANTGFVQSKSEQADINITLMHSKGFKFKDDKTYYLKVSAQDDNVDISVIRQIVSQDTVMLSEGFDLTISPFVSLAAGFGGGILKIEICANLFCTLTLSLGRDDEPTFIHDFDWGFSISLNVQLILFTFSLEIFGLTRHYDHETGWGDIQWKCFDRESKQSGAKRGGSIDYDAVMSLPEDTSDTQTVYTAQDGSLSGLLKSYLPTDRSVPFELSGYYSSSDAAKLLDGVITGYDYRVVTAKNANGEDVNYVVYHISGSEAESSIDRSLLVMSELVMTGSEKGLVNPVDRASDTPYIVVDVDEKGAADPAGDLDFSAEAIDGGSKIQVVWVSYIETAKAGTKASLQALDDAAKNTVVKTATYTPGDSAFAAYTAIDDKGDPNADDKNGECVLIPDASGDAVAFVRSNHITSDEMDDRTAMYENYLRSKGYDVAETGTSDEAVSRRDYAISLVSTKRGSWTTSGESSDLCVQIGKSAVASIPMEDGVIIDSVKIEEIDEEYNEEIIKKYYIAYTTSEECYTDDQGNAVTGSGDVSNYLTIKRLYLRTCTLGKDDKENDVVEWGMDGKAILLRTLYDYDDSVSGSALDQGTSGLYDGIYVDGTIQYKDSPYFDNLQFLSGELGDTLSGTPEEFPLRKNASAEDFLLFDMCGSTYIIRQDSLQAMTGASIVTDGDGNATTTGTVIPFFTPDVSDTTDNGARASSGRIGTTIGADGEGNLVAVYTIGMPNTNNTALCISKYDPQAGCWGDKTVLAMNYLGVYEDNLRLFRSDADAKKAFFGTLEAEDEETVVNKGGLNEFKFGNPQIALGKETVIEDGETVQHPTLLVLTQGTMKYYQENPDEDTKDQFPYLPVDDDIVRAHPEDYERSDTVPPGVGIYAIEYGAGTQAVGNVTFSMDEEDYSIGATPYVNISFENTGDVAIRGSEQQPITVTLYASDQSEAPLAQWTITENVIPGQKAALSGEVTLTRTLPVGTKIYLSVKEDTYYEDLGGTPFSAVSKELVEIEEHVELAVRDADLDFDFVHEDGDTLVDMAFNVDNRGTADAQSVYAVLSYDTGEVDENGNEIFAPLDLSGSEIGIEGYEVKRGVRDNRANGELAIGDIAVGHGAHITGNLKVSSDYFNEKATDALAVRIEVFSAADEQLPEDTPVGKHNEYNSANNTFSGSVEHHTVFTAPTNITIPKGTEIHIPVKCDYTMGLETPHILVTEFEDDDHEMQFGKAAFRYGEFGTGTGSGILELKAENEGSGYLRIKDVSNNSYYDIAYVVTPPVDGVNIYYKEHGIFTFYNADGSRFDKDAVNQSWKFPDSVNTWGSDATVPYMNDLTMGAVEKGKDGGYFVFRTDAESIDLVFRGKVRVESTFEGFEPVTVTATGGDGSDAGEYASVTFGSNPKGHVHAVTVTVLDGDENPTSPFSYASFDRIIEHYNKHALPIPDTDNSAPQIFFSRSCPDARSIPTMTADNQKNSITIDAYIFDETGIASVIFNGKVAPVKQKDNVGFWTVELTFSGNGVYAIVTIDDLGNMSKHQLHVNWFADSVQEESTGVPTVQAALMKRGAGGQGDVELTDSVPFTDDDSAYITASGVTSTGSGSPDFTVTEVTVTQKNGLVSGAIDADEDGTYPARSKGWYLVQATDPDSHGDRWSVTVVEMMRLSKNQLFITTENKSKHPGTADPALTYQATGLLPGDEFSGSLAREEGEEIGTYAITLGTLSAGDDYKVFYTGATLTIDHSFSAPKWTWQYISNVVDIDLGTYSTVEIGPTKYTLTKKSGLSTTVTQANSEHTQYVFSCEQGSGSFCKVILHDVPRKTATYNICFKNLYLIDTMDDFITIAGDNASVNLTLSGANNVYAHDHVFAAGSGNTTGTTIKIAKEGADDIYMRSTTANIATNRIQLVKDGDYQISYQYQGIDHADDFSDVYTNEVLFISGGQPDAAVPENIASATFACTHCTEKVTVEDRSPVVEYTTAGCETEEAITYSAKVTFRDKEYTDGFREVKSPALGHNFKEPSWEWYDSDGGVVEIDMGAHQKISLTPDGYSLDDADPVKKRSAYTKYVLTGTTSDVEVSVHDGESSAATYYICMRNLSLNTNHSFITVKGNNATLNVSLSGESFIQCLGGECIFTNGDPQANTAMLNLAKEDNCTTTFCALKGMIFDAGISFNKIGEYSIQGTDVPIGLKSALSMWDFKGGANNPDPYERPSGTLAVFTCSRCHEERVVEATVAQQYIDDRPYLTATAEFNGKTYTDSKAIPLPETYMIGDADMSGDVSILDATCIQRYLVGYTVSSFDIDAASVTDDELGILDATAIQRYLASFHDGHRIGESVSRNP